jgi:hypothetical protein
MIEDQKNIQKKLKESTTHSVVTRLKNSGPETNIFKWAWLGDYDNTLEKLNKFVLPEQWYYGQKFEGKYPILDSYLKFTFYRLQLEKKVKEGKEFAAFNTGLVDKKYKPVYALFKKEERKPEWVFNNFCVDGEDWPGKQLVSNFRPLPERANYFKKVIDMIYDTTAGKPSLDHNHILIENVARLPQAFIVDNCPKGFQLKDISPMEPEERKEYFNNLGEAIKRDERNFRYMKGRLDDAVELAIQRTVWNFKTAIPMYFPRRDKMSLLLPLSLVNDEKVDIALVMERVQSGAYLGHTILPLHLAYSNARLVTRPDSDWLVAKKIETIYDGDES